MDSLSPVTIIRYRSANEEAWNDFVSRASKATFLFDRRYMDYHSDRFRDHSLLIYIREKLVGLFVANEEDDVIHSHGGLTYGGLILENDARTEDYLRCFFHVLRYYSPTYSSIVYKCFPTSFTRYPSDEVAYGLFLLKAELVAREVNCVFDRHAPLAYRKSRLQTIKMSQEKSYVVARSDNPEVFWSKMLEPNLQRRFGAKPVHSVDEIRLLMKRFPANIQLYELYGPEILAGAVIYVMDDVVHTQYLSATVKGKEVGALDILIDHLITNVYSNKSRFSFGTSNEKAGRKLKIGLMAWKEGFGARARVQDTYKIRTDQYYLLDDYQ